MALVTAWRYVARVELVDLDELVALGIRCLLLDRDNTIVPRDTKRAPESVRAWIGRAHELGLTVCFVSNNFHSKQVEASARELGCDVVHHAMKPFPFAVRHALRKMGVKPSEAILIGDQLYTDIIAGNLSGLRTILVRPQSTVDLWYTQIMRIGERMLLRGQVFEGE